MLLESRPRRMALDQRRVNGGKRVRHFRKDGRL
jgi:hypothetical protein